ncbi:gliding motility-associated C-terminal domain-containing protein [Kaistella montana]|uniref:Gliding motility-associated C-terminal domain-containing protein n=1 Tax=Kaistella montana TaxID=1849733 RepID=A0ABW5K714_9FLAO|nr:gliding motility-associated C-terminal domain-containing protein [Kaistella montana]MCQ4034997.1 gliding motility-associated C-terminal domain-containing protein [Kaistella montana]
MRRIYMILFVLLLINGFAQSVNLYNPYTNVNYPDKQYFCTDEKFKLKVDAVATSTGDYAITKDLPSNYPFSAGSTPINFDAAGSNKFSEAFPIGFFFSFYGKTYTKVVMGSNGRLVFTNDPTLDFLKDPNIYTDRTFSGISGYNGYSVLPSTDYNKVYKSPSKQELNLAQIFFGYTDLVPKSQNSSVNHSYKNLSIGGVQALMVSFQNQIRTNGTGLNSSTSYYSNIILFADGRIVIYVNNKTEYSYNAILGIQNENATKFKVPQHSNNAFNYNNGSWNSEGVVWVFKPNQNLTPQFKWYKNATPLSETSSTLSNFVPNDGDILKVEVTYFDEFQHQVGDPETKTVTFNQLKKAQITDPDYSSGCGNPAKISVINPDPNLTYEWHSTTDPTFLQTGTSITVGNGSYFVRVKNSTTNCTEDSDMKSVSISSVLPPFLSANKTIYRCDQLNLPSKTFNLASETDYPTGPDYTYYFTESGSTTPITTINLNSGQTKNLTLHATTNSGITPSCNLTSIFSISYLSFPENGKVLTSNKLCDNITSYTTTDFKNTFYPGSVYDVTFSTDGTTFNTNPVNPKTNNSIFVKLSAANFNCESRVKLNFDFFPSVIANQPSPNDPNLQQCASSQTYNLHALFDNLVNNGDVTISYHFNLEDAKKGDNPILNASAYRSGMGETTLYIRVVDNSTNCVADAFPIITLYVYNTPKFKNPLGINLKKCAGEKFNLSQNITDLLESVDSKINYVFEYLAENGTLLTKDQYENYDPTVFGFKPKITLKYNSTCSGTVIFNLSYYPKPTSILSQLVICEELNYSLADFQNAVINNSNQYTFTDEFGNPLSITFDVSILPKTVKFFIKDKTTGCVSDLQTVTFVKGSNTPLLKFETDFLVCDTDFDGKISFDLNSKKADFNTNSNAIFEYFKDENFTQPIAVNYTNEIAFSQTVYARISIPGFCLSTGKINLKVNTPTLSSTLQSKYYICYGETLTIDAGTENPFRTWSTGETSQTVSITKVGNYSVELTNSLGCTYTHNFTVSDENQPKIDLINQTNNSIEVIASGGAAPYRYYFNGVGQPTATLMNPTASSYTVQVESATGCLGEPKTIYFIKIHNAFTPNGDGINDTWTIENLDKMESFTIQIVDRYGNKVFESQNNKKFVWDGKSNGRALPTGTYWYNVVWFDTLTQKSEQRQGWVLLKNRN